jgi:hypothetical protein
MPMMRVQHVLLAVLFAVFADGVEARVRGRGSGMSDEEMNTMISFIAVGAVIVGGLFVLLFLATQIWLNTGNTSERIARCHEELAELEASLERAKSSYDTEKVGWVALNNSVTIRPSSGLHPPFTLTHKRPQLLQIKEKQEEIETWQGYLAHFEKRLVEEGGVVEEEEEEEDQAATGAAGTAAAERKAAKKAAAAEALWKEEQNQLAAHTDPAAYTSAPAAYVATNPVRRCMPPPLRGSNLQQSRRLTIGRAFGMPPADC